jgi:hypothetical protein
MLSAKAIFEEISGNDEASGLFCSIAASGEAQAGAPSRRGPRVPAAGCEPLF